MFSHRKKKNAKTRNASRKHRNREQQSVNNLFKKHKCCGAATRARPNSVSLTCTVPSAGRRRSKRRRRNAMQPPQNCLPKCELLIVMPRLIFTRLGFCFPTLRHTRTYYFFFSTCFRSFSNVDGSIWREFLFKTIYLIVCRWRSKGVCCNWDKIKKGTNLQKKNSKVYLENNLKTLFIIFITLLIVF